MTVKWSDFIDAVHEMLNNVKKEMGGFDPAKLTNNLDHEMYYIVGYPGKDENGKDVEKKRIVKLGKGENMLAVCPECTDVEGYVDNTGHVVKFAGRISEMIQGKSIEEFYVQWMVRYINYADRDIIDSNGMITNIREFTERHKDWKDAMDQIPHVSIMGLEPKCGGDLDRCEHETGGSNFAIRPIEMPGEGGLFRKGVKSFTKWIWNPNFESTEGWNYPSQHYQVTPSDGPNGYFNNHCLIAKRIPATSPAPTGMYQDLIMKLNGIIRFGCNIRKISGPEDATVVIAIWSLTTTTPSSTNYRMPVSEMYFDCYTDAYVEWEDLLRIEIYLPENSEYCIGGTYLLQQYTEIEPEVRPAHPAPPDDYPPERPGGSAGDRGGGS